MRRNPRASPVKGAPEPVPAIWIPLRVAFVADVVNGEDGRHGGMEWRRVGRSVDEIDSSAARDPRQTDGGPSQVGRRMPGLRDPLNARRHRVGFSTERNQIERRTDRQQRTDQLRCIAANAGGW